MLSTSGSWWVHIKHCLGPQTLLLLCRGREDERFRDEIESQASSLCCASGMKVSGVAVRRSPKAAQFWQ